jgi:hypothetical protein
MFDKNLFKFHVNKSNVTMESIANKIGINAATLYRKINGESDFTRGEIQIIRMLLNLTADEADRIFFTEELA